MLHSTIVAIILGIDQYIYWLVVWNVAFIFPYMSFIIQTDEVIFFQRSRAQSPTSIYIYISFPST